MTARITHQEATHRIKTYLSDYAKFDKDLSILNKQCAEIRRRRNDAEQQINLLARALKLSGSSISSQQHTFLIDYVSPKVSLSQKLLKETLCDFFKHRTNITSPEEITNQFLEYLDNSKQNAGLQREKSLKIKYS